MPRTLLLSGFILLLACDPQQLPTVAKSGAAPAKDGHHGAAKPDAAAVGGDAVAGTYSSLSECLQACDHEKVIETNRATCRLNCDSSYGAPATALAPVAGGTTPAGGAVATDPVEQAVTCMGGCYSKSGGVTNSCVETCKATASATANAPGGNALDQLGGCMSACYSDNKLTETNRATCELNCAQAARVTGPRAAR